MALSSGDSPESPVIKNGLCVLRNPTKGFWRPIKRFLSVSNCDSGESQYGKNNYGTYIVMVLRHFL